MCSGSSSFTTMVVSGTPPARSTAVTSGGLS
jgi:hypothetical protein